MPNGADMSDEERVRRYREDPRPETFEPAFRILKCKYWRRFQGWLAKHCEKFGPWPRWYPDDFEERFDDKLQQAMEAYDPERGASFRTFLWKLSARGAFDVVRRLAGFGKEGGTVDEGHPARSDEEPPHKAMRHEEEALYREAVLREPADCQALLQLWEDPNMPSRGFYKQAAEILTDYPKTAGGWKTTFHRNLKDIRGFLGGHGYDFPV